MHMAHVIMGVGGRADRLRSAVPADTHNHEFEWNENGHPRLHGAASGDAAGVWESNVDVHYNNQWIQKSAITCRGCSFRSLASTHLASSLDDDV